MKEGFCFFLCNRQGRKRTTQKNKKIKNKRNEDEKGRVL